MHATPTMSAAHDTTAPWRPSAAIAVLRRRAEMLQRIRAFFAARGVWEVDTPLLGAAPVTDPHIEAIRTEPAVAGAGPLYLQTSPEYAMKRLLAAGSGPIYQICKAFRRGERGRRHHPEFTMLEWYRPGLSLEALMREVADLYNALTDSPRALRFYRYGELFARHFGVNPHRAGAAELQALARARLDVQMADADRDTWLQLLFAEVVEPGLGKGELSAVTDFPASQCALAEVETDSAGDRVARRCELFIDGMELANAYRELTDPAEQAARFERDCESRRAAGAEVPPIDKALLAALAAGMPPCAGVAVGLDRLMMLVLGADDIGEVISFTD